MISYNGFSFGCMHFSLGNYLYIRIHYRSRIIISALTLIYTCLTKWRFMNSLRKHYLLAGRGTIIEHYMYVNSHSSNKKQPENACSPHDFFFTDSTVNSTSETLIWYSEMHLSWVNHKHLENLIFFFLSSMDEWEARLYATIPSCLLGGKNSRLYQSNVTPQSKCTSIESQIYMSCSWRWAPPV